MELLLLLTVPLITALLLPAAAAPGLDWRG